jgi:hypothetical protein
MTPDFDSQRFKQRNTSNVTIGARCPKHLTNVRLHDTFQCLDCYRDDLATWTHERESRKAEARPDVLANESPANR